MEEDSINEVYEQLLLPLNLSTPASSTDMVMDIYSASESIDAEHQHLHTISPSYSFNKLNPSDNDYNSFIFIKSRSQVFRQFMDQCKYRFDEIKNSPVDDSRNECKKRTKYWAYKLFDEVPIYIHKIFYISNEENIPKWVNLNKEFLVTPIGLDIWGTIGGVFQDADFIEWEKSLLMFLPTTSLKKILNDPFIDLCFTTPGHINLPEKPQQVKESKREIKL